MGAGSGVGRAGESNRGKPGTNIIEQQFFLIFKLKKGKLKIKRKFKRVMSQKPRDCLLYTSDAADEVY